MLKVGGDKILSIGLFLLGLGALIFALLAVHFYIVEVLPHISQHTGLGTYCQMYKPGEAIITVNNYGTEGIKEASIYLNGKLACKLSEIPPGSSDICKAKAEGNTTNTFRVIAVLENGRKLKDAGICPEYTLVPGRRD